jgi:hypothetical protein
VKLPVPAYVCDQVPAGIFKVQVHQSQKFIDPFAKNAVYRILYDQFTGAIPFDGVKLTEQTPTSY